MIERDPLLSEAYRDADHPVPPPALDAAVLDAARHAVAPAPHRRWFAWAAPMATTAVLVLGLSMLLRIREEAPETLREAPPPSPAARSEPAPTASPGTPADLAAQPAPAASPPRSERGDARLAEARSAPTPAPATLTPALAPQAASPEAAVAPQAPPEPRPFPAPAASTQQLEALRPAPPVPAAASPSPRQADRLERAAPAPAPAREAAPSFNQGMHKLKAASPGAEGPEPWVETIRQLLRQGRGEEARKALEELRRRYPEFELPEDLRAIR